MTYILSVSSYLYACIFINVLLLAANSLLQMSNSYLVNANDKNFKLLTSYFRELYDNTVNNPLKK